MNPNNRPVNEAGPIMLGLACPDLSGARMDLLGLTRPPSAEPRKPSPHFIKWTPLRSDLKKRFDKSRYPFFEHAEAEFLIARREGRVVGRVVAIKNDSHIDFHEEQVGFLGFFESVEDSDNFYVSHKGCVKW